jgi:hypothetical protein
MWTQDVGIEVLKGLTLSKVERVKVGYTDEIHFTTVDGKVFKMLHEQDCCESVGIKDICGDLNDLVGSEVILAEQSSNEGGYTDDGSSTWTFYKLGTKKGFVTISWIGSSNGYYSEDVSFIESK